MHSEPTKNTVHSGFKCPDAECGGMVRIDFFKFDAEDYTCQCPECHRIFKLSTDLRGKLGKLHRLMEAIHDADSILSETTIAVTTPAGEVKIPYKLLLTRLNTMISLNLPGGAKADFRFWIEPTSQSIR